MRSQREDGDAACWPELTRTIVRLCAGIILVERRHEPRPGTKTGRGEVVLARGCLECGVAFRTIGAARAQARVLYRNDAYARLDTVAHWAVRRAVEGAVVDHLIELEPVATHLLPYALARGWVHGGCRRRAWG